MKNLYRLPCQLSVASSLVLAACGALAQQTDTTDSDAYAPLALENRPTLTLLQAGYAGAVELGVGYTDDDNYTFGEYNGLYKDEATLIGNLLWQDFSAGTSYWQVSGSDLGLDTREGKVTWGRADRMRVSAGFDSQIQVGNDNGRTPFSGGSHQQLPDSWVSGLNTGDWTALDESLRGFDQELKRDKVFLEFDTRLSKHWRLESGFSHEKKDGNSNVGGGIYIDGSSADAVLLNQPVDYRTSEFDLGLLYSDERFQVEGRLNYSDFDNKDDVLTWQNPYSAYGPAVSYPEGVGGLGLAPDNEQISGRITGQYIYSPMARLQFDGSYGVASQDQDYLDYTVNPALAVTQPVPRNNFDGEVATGTFNTRMLMQPLKKLNAEIFYKYRDRDYDANRDGYLYVRGDGSDQPAAQDTVYNTNHDFRSQTGGFEVGYRLPLRSKVTFEYEYEEIKRRNSAVEKTEEDRYTLGYRLQPWSNVTARFELGYADRAADTYQWAQSYYALLDTELINATPDNQRYINHPQLSQYYLANREQWKTKADFTWLPSEKWNLGLNLQWLNDDYDQSQLGLTRTQWYRSYLSATFLASANLSASVYVGYDQYKNDQGSRAFRGGAEKNAFEIYPPLPQASDPSQNWSIDGEDTSITLGTSVEWQVAADIQLAVSYHYVDTQGEQDMNTNASSTLVAGDLPNVNTRLHQVEASGTWDLQKNLSLKLDYQYYSYKNDDWAWDNVSADTIGKVLTFGQGNPNDDINYIGASVIYRWQ
jgi:MtrB/PioB family decaheme-associated outer membrane protein